MEDLGGFPIYTDKQLGKVNALRAAKSLVQITTPTLGKSAVLFVTAESRPRHPTRTRGEPCRLT